MSRRLPRMSWFRQRNLLITLACLLAVGVAAALWLPRHSRAALWRSDPVTAAWQKALAAGSYHFTSDLLQKSIPLASLANVGRSSRSDALYLEGQNDLRTHSMELTLWSQGGSALNADSGVSLRTADGKSYTRRGGRSASSAEPWQESDNFVEGFAPQGDFLGYLAAIRDVKTVASETRGGISFTRYTFTIDGPALARYLHEQMIAALRAKGELPPSVQLDVPAYYRDLTGNGELWVGTNGLPVRQILNLTFPEQNEERVEAAITVNFSNYGAEEIALWTLLRSGQWQAAWLVLPGRLPDLTGLWLTLALSGAAFWVVRYRRLRTVQTALVSVVIVSQIVGPLLSSMSQARFFDSYRAKAATQEANQAAATQDRQLRTAIQSSAEFNPHQSPLELGREEERKTGRQEDWQSATQSPDLSISQSPALQLSDPGTDTDQDGLTDFSEVRIGTSEVLSDTDDDGLPDNLEVNGFTMSGQSWYSDPNAQDSNHDGLADVVEWGLDSSGNLRPTPLDSDGDGLPDLFDPDNDNDGVPDPVDSAPFSKGAATYDEANPLQFSINNLTPDRSTFVDFQIRPAEPKNLWFAYNVLDWPQDSDGQMRDVDGKSYADVAASSGRTADGSESNGDMKLLPMLEIRIPKASANLPSQAELTPFNISLNDFSADGQTQVAYVPLTIVTDPLTGERVAFSGQMRYKPTGSWTTPHSVRLAWVVQALNDLPCDPKNADNVAQGCQPDGYVPNQPVMLQSYYDNWTLTGLTVREDQGSSMAIVYEDPAVDANPKDEAALWALSLVLDHHFMTGRDENNDTLRDLKVSDLATRFDHDNNPSEAQRFAIPNTLQVVTKSYATGAEATAATVMTETLKILDTSFKPVVTADNAVKPLLLFAQEQNLRVVSLDQVAVGEGYATQSGANLTLNLAPTVATALPVSVVAGLKWMVYCGANGNNVTWRPCTSDEYAGVIESRYAGAPSLAGDAGPDAASGRMVLAMGYYASLTVGYGVTVQEGPAVISSKYRLESESETVTRVRAGLNSLTPVPLLTVQTMQRILSLSTAGNSDLLTRLSSSFDNLLETIGKSYAQIRAEVDVAMNNAHIDTGAGGPKQPVTRTRLSALAPRELFQVRMARLTAIGVAGGVLMAVTTALSAVPDLNVTARTVLGVVAVATTALTTVILPVATAVYTVQARTAVRPDGVAEKANWGKVLKSSTLQFSWQKVGGMVGLALSLGLIWGFFIGGAAASGYTAGSPQLNKAFFEAVAATIVTVLLVALSATFIGTILVGIITVLDTLLNLICELGVDALRVQGNFYGGACFSITTSATKVLAYFLYNYEPMIDTSRTDLMVAGSPHVTLADPNKGYVPSNTLTLDLPVTTTVVHKDPDPSNGLYINLYLWLFSPDNLRSSTFKYGLSQGAPANQAVERNQMTGAWQDVREDHKYVLTPMYRGIASTDPAPLSGIELTQGINSSIPFSLTMSFAVPAYECILVPIPYAFIIIPTPICYTRDLKNDNTMPLTILKYDVLPNTLSEFLALTNKPGGGLGQSWDSRLPALADADGDGLRSAAANGLDPNDSSWDADGDGLSDRFELEQRAVGTNYSPVLRDTDGDGLTDKQEAEIGTDPANPDTDNDGLPDGVEVRHQLYDANGNLTTAWAGGWQVTLNTTPARTIWVSSDPYLADSDRDGISDQAEKELAANANAALRLDSQGIPYHPQVPNTSPLVVLTESDAFNGYVGPGQSFGYTTTVIANLPLAAGVLNIAAPAIVGGAPNPLPLNFSLSPTVTQMAAFAVASNAVGQNFSVTSTVNTRLPDTSSTPWVWQTPTNGTGLGTFSSRLGRFINGAPLPDRQDGYRLAGVASTGTGIVAGLGDIFGYSLPSGTSTLLDTDATGATSARGGTPAALACNLSSTCLAVWEKKPAGTSTGDLLGILIQPNGSVTTAPFTIVAGAANSSGNSNAKVASDGTNFLVAWQQEWVDPNTPTLTFVSTLMTRLYNPSGTPLTAAITLPNEQIAAASTNATSLSGLNGSRARRQQLDLDWLNGRYRLTRWIDLGTAASASDVTLTENNAAITNRQLTWRDLDANGALIANSKFTISGLLSGFPTDVSLSYHPTANRVLLVVAGFDSVEASPLIVARSFVGTGTSVSRSYTILSTDATNNVEAVYYPPQQGYLIGWSPTSNASNFTYKLYDSDVNEMTQFGTPAAVTWPAATNSSVGASMLCPAVSSQPVVDLRFEELPGASDFVDNSGYNTLVYCDAGQCPAAGVSGAPNALLSDYALHFDGVNDRLAVNRTLTDDFTVAMWIKTAGPTNPYLGVLLDQGLFSDSSGGWGLYLSSANITFESLVNRQVNAFNAGVNDNQWHFIAVTHNRATSLVSIYKDGALLTSATHPSNPFTAQSQIWIGDNATNHSSFAYKGDMDALQLYPVALSASAIQALYNRTAQSYCVAASVTATGNTFPWARFGLQQQDVRGGRISASGSLKLIVDNSAPTAQITSHANNAIVAPDTVIGGSASDSGVGVGKVEVSTDNGATWQVANGANTWSFSLAGLSGLLQIRVRATDLVGNVGTASATVNLTVDATAPTLAINAQTGTLKPTKNSAGQWQVPLSGTASDSSGLKAGSLLLKLTQASGVGLAQSQQAATLNGSNWSLNYLLDPSLFDPTGAYTLTAQVDDGVGNRTLATQVVQLDASGPIAMLSAGDGARTVISQTLTIGGLVSDTDSVAGIDKLEIAFTPVEQIAALPVGLNSEQAEAQLNRQWLPVTLAQRGAGVAQTTWSVAIPTGLENSYQIDLRGTDMLGNVSITSGLWRGIIDTSDPRVVMSATATGATYVDTADNTQRYAVQFVCAVQDRYLDESSFVCPGAGVAEPVRSFESIPALQALFPDLTLRSGLAISYTLWMTSPTPAATTSACDSFGRCAQAVTGGSGAVQGANLQSPISDLQVAAPGAPLAVIVNPTNNSFVAAGNLLSVTVAAEAGAGLKEISLKLDNATVQTLSFAQTESVTRTVRTLNLPITGEGSHTLFAQASDWANGTQSTIFPVVFTLDQQAPALTIDPSALTIADTWQAGSGVLRFHGTASDSVGLAAVQIREGENDFTDATFGNGTWQVALPVADPEGRTLNITVRAIDRAGRSTQLLQAIGTNLSAADAPDTTINGSPANPSSSNTAQFTFSGSASAVAFDCQLDAGDYTACASPTTYNELSKGSHIFRVRAIDSRGYPDLSPAQATWTVNASSLDANISSQPANPSNSRAAPFTFTGNGSSLECSLDGAPFSACSSPQNYSGLSNGEHSFQVRAISGGTVGAAARYGWTVVNLAPLASDQTVNTAQDSTVAISLSASDEDALTYRLTQPAHGLLLGVAPALTYAPNTGFSGTDSFTFVANDGQVDSNVATVTIQVAGNAPPTPTPTATSQATATPTETSAATPTGTGVAPTATATNTPLGATATPTNTPQGPTATPTNTPAAATATPTNTPAAATATPTHTPLPSGTLIGTCGSYSVYRNNNVYSAAGWSGTIQVGTSGNNTLNGSNGADLILGLGGNDKIDGKGGDDVLCGGDGVDQVLGSAGNDFLDGGNGNDVLNGGSGDYDRLVAGDGNDVLLDGDGVLSAEGGAGNDAFTLALRNGWRDPNGQPRFTGLAAGYGNDTVGLAILNLTRFLIDITGDERDIPPNSLEGKNDALVVAALLNPASVAIKFERRLGIATPIIDEGSTDTEPFTVDPMNFADFLVDPTTLTDESGAEFLSEAVGDGSEVFNNRYYIPFVTQ